jgi:hypothetical protein
MKTQGRADRMWLHVVVSRAHIEFWIQRLHRMQCVQLHNSNVAIDSWASWCESLSKQSLYVICEPGLTYSRHSIIPRLVNIFLSIITFIGYGIWCSPRTMEYLIWLVHRTEYSVNIPALSILINAMGMWSCSCKAMRPEQAETRKDNIGTDRGNLQRKQECQRGSSARN